MAEAFVRTIKRDYVRVSPCPDAQTVMHQSPAQGSRISFTPRVHRSSRKSLTVVRSFGGYNRKAR